MQGTGRQPNTRRCACCGADSYLYASFCIACGEPFDEAVDRDASPAEASWDTGRPAGADDGRWTMDDGNKPDAILTPHRPSPIYDGLPLVHRLSSIVHRLSSIVHRPSSGKLARRETILGLLVLVAVVGYAIFDWQRVTVQSAAYREGVAAERARDWDEAASAFEKAGDHRDADTKAHNARYQVAERDRLYVEGVTAGEQQDWKAAATALEQVQAIQPDFADSAERLVQARTQAFKLELDGLVYQVSDGAGAGLYMLDDTGRPTLLPGSDGSSTVRAISSDGSTFVYDRSDSASTVNHARNLGVLFNPADVGRGPVLATLDHDKIKTQPIPAVNSGGTGVFAADGLWWYSGWLSQHPDRGFDQYEVYYTNYAPDPLTRTAVRLAGPFSSQRVLAFDPPRSRVVIAEAREAPGTRRRETVIHIAAAGGADPSDVAVVPGEVQSASVSRDGRWMLLIAQEAAGRLERSVWLARVPSQTGGGNRQPPRKLDTVTLNAASASQPTHLDAAFVPVERQPAQVIVDRVQDGLESLTLYNADGTGAASIWNTTARQGPGADAGAGGYDLAGFSNDGHYLASKRQDGPRSILQLWSLFPEDPVHWWSAPLPPSPGRAATVQFSPRDNYVLAAVDDARGPGRYDTQTIYAAPVKPEGGIGEARPLATARQRGNQRLPTYALAAEGSLLAYVNTKDELHVVFYDGNLDTLLAGAVSAVWSLRGEFGSR